MKIHCSVLAEDAIKSAIADFPSQARRTARAERERCEPAEAAVARARRPASEPGSEYRHGNLSRIHRDAAPASPSEAPKSRREITISAKAVEFATQKLAKRGTPDAAVRLGIRGGGCSGFSYVIEFDDEPPRRRSRYRVRGRAACAFFVDKKSLVYLGGSVLDWEKTLMFQGFKFKNPQEATRCGCGHSVHGSLSATLGRRADVSMERRWTRSRRSASSPRFDLDLGAPRAAAPRSESRRSTPIAARGAAGAAERRDGAGPRRST